MWVGKVVLTNVILALATIRIEDFNLLTIVLITHNGGFKPNVIKLDKYTSKAVKSYINIE